MFIMDHELIMAVLGEVINSHMACYGSCHGHNDIYRSVHPAINGLPLQTNTSSINSYMIWVCLGFILGLL